VSHTHTDNVFYVSPAFLLKKYKTQILYMASCRLPGPPWAWFCGLGGPHCCMHATWFGVRQTPWMLKQICLSLHAPGMSLIPPPPPPNHPRPRAPPHLGSVQDRTPCPRAKRVWVSCEIFAAPFLVNAARTPSRTVSSAHATTAFVDLRRATTPPPRRFELQSSAHALVPLPQPDQYSRASCTTGEVYSVAWGGVGGGGGAGAGGSRSRVVLTVR
jgi:hypothetical protein